MANAEKKRLTALLRATESDKELLAGVGLKFRDLYTELDRSQDPLRALDSFLADLPEPKKN